MASDQVANFWSLYWPFRYRKWDISVSAGFVAVGEPLCHKMRGIGGQAGAMQQQAPAGVEPSEGFCAS